MKRITTTLTLCALTLLATGCETDEAANYPSCVDTQTAITADEITPLGYSAQSVLDTSVGSYVNTVDFVDGSSTEITVDLSHSEGNLYFVDSEPEESDGDEQLAIGVECLDFILIEADLSITTEDGKLNESSQINLFSYDESYAQTALVRTPEELQGSLEAVSDPSEWDEIRFSIFTTFSESGNAGTISETATVSDDSGDDDGVATARITEIASWPRSL